MTRHHSQSQATPIVVNVAPTKPVVQIIQPTPAGPASDHAGEVTAWATVVLTLATIALAYLTWVLARATSRPSVILTIEPNPAAIHWLDLHIANEGNATAFDIDIKFDPPLPSTGGQIETISAPSKIALLRAGQHLSSSLCEAFVLLEASFTVSISWKLSPRIRKRQRISYPINIHHLKTISRLGDDPAIATATEIKKLREAFDKIVAGRSRLKVDSFSQSDRNAEQEARSAHYMKIADIDRDPTAIEKFPAIPLTQKAKDFFRSLFSWTRR